MKYQGNDYYAVYSGFMVQNEAAKYRISLTSCRGGTAPDDFRMHNSRMFTTWDSDNDEKSSGNCAVESKGGFWYRNCHHVNVNGEWASHVLNKGINWLRLTSNDDSLDCVEMKVRLTESP